MTVDAFRPHTYSGSRVSRPLGSEKRLAPSAYMWLPLEEIEQGALDQIENLLALPPTVAVAVMPDVHRGYGMPIGTALATKDALVPYAVGVDIGCGMVAAQLGVMADALRPSLRTILQGIFDAVPVGQPSKGRDRNAGSFAERQNSVVLRDWVDGASASVEHAWRASVRERADRQLGTLGGGNHFIEIQEDEHGDAWLMLHTGSRSMGKVVCDQYQAIALEMAKRHYTPLPDPELAFLPADHPAGRAYLHDMQQAMRFAEESRARILDRCLSVIDDHVGGLRSPGMRIETHHNYAARERHFGQDLFVHRKGAVRTTQPDGGDSVLVTIPGSMQTGSFIGTGKASVLAMNTCAHGAGRRLGRNEMRRQNVGRDISSEMAAQGIELVCPDGADVLDEGGDAYKPIEDVMAYQADLVTPTIKLRPLGTVKG